MGILTEEMNRVQIRMYDYGEGLDYMSDMKNWVCVHLTKYEPKRNADDDLCIETTGMATGYKLPRGTVHVTLNKTVGNVMGGNWDEAAIVILAPYNDVVRKNGNPQEIAMEDTYFAPNPDTGLVLPDSTYIIRPDPKSEKLFEIGEHGATYKTDNYTKEEIEEILSLDDGGLEKAKYEQYLTGDIPEYDVKLILGYDRKLIKLYDNAKDKKAFMRGVLEESKFVILNHLLRNAVVKMSLEKMGYHYVNAHEDNITGKVAEVARDAGISGDSGNKGHSCSVEIELEHHGCMIASLADVLKSKNVDDIYDYLTEYKRPLSDEITANILSDTPLPDIHETFEKVYNDYVERCKAHFEMDRDSNYVPEEVMKRRERTIRNMEKGLKEYCPNLDTTLHRHSKRMKLECTQALKELRQDKEAFAALKERLSRSQEPEKDIDDEIKEMFGKQMDGPENDSFMSMFIDNGKGGR